MNINCKFSRKIAETTYIGIPRHVLTRVYGSPSNNIIWDGNKQRRLRTHNKFEDGRYYLLIHKYSEYSLIIKYESLKSSMFDNLKQAIINSGEEAYNLIYNDLVNHQSELWQVYRFNYNEDAINYLMIKELRR